MHLSESQVIRHLSMSFSRADRHFQTAKEKAKTPFCSVRDWLDTIRDFYFTNGQFRLHVETAWKSYRAGQAVDFNDFVHHVRTYYQLIFLDYPELPSKMNKHDFARHLFDKVHYLMSPDCNSTLGMTVRMFLALPDLLSKLRLHIEPAPTWIDSRSAREADMFIAWCVDQVQAAKDSANSAKRYATATTNQFHGVDFASDSSTADMHPRARPGTFARKVTTRPYVTMAYRYNAPQSHDKPPFPQHKHPRAMQQMPPPAPASILPSAQPGAGARPKPPCPFPELSSGTALTFAQQADFVATYITHEQMPRFIRLLHDHEISGGKDTIAHLGSVLHRASGRRVPFKASTVSFYIINQFYNHNLRLCGLCSHAESPTPASRYHVLGACPTLQRFPETQAALRIFLANPANTHKALMATDPSRPLPPLSPPADSGPSAPIDAAAETYRKRCGPSERPAAKRVRFQSLPDSHIR